MFFQIMRRYCWLCAAFGFTILAVFLLFFDVSKSDPQPVMEQCSRSILIIDAGHGGVDGGTSLGDGLLESDVNLSIALKLDALSRFCGLETVMTRETAEINYPPEADTIAKKKAFDQKTRIALINSCPQGVLISIHQNYYPDSRPAGAQVLYGHTPEGERLGKLLQERLVSCLDPGNRRVAAPIDDNIYLMRSAKCTAVLVECGFLSNPGEAERLRTEDHQKKLTVVMLGAYLEYDSRDKLQQSYCDETA